MRKCVDVAGSQSFHYGKKTHRYEMLRGRREPFGKGLELEVLVRTQDFMGFPGRSVGKKIRLQCRKPWLDSWVWKILCRRDRLPAPVFLGFPCGSAGKESDSNAGDLGLIPGLGRSPGEGIGYLLQYSWASLVAQLVKNPPAMQETWVRSRGWEDSPGEGTGYPLQYSGLETSWTV